jgi:hypothetical protein
VRIIKILTAHVSLFSVKEGGKDATYTGIIIAGFVVTGESVVQTALQLNGFAVLRSLPVC